MRLLLILTLLSAFTFSTAASFLSGRFLKGVLPPILCFVLYLLVTSAHQGGWKLEGFLTVSAFSVAILMVLGLPIVLISAVGAGMGIALSKRRREASAK